MENIISRLLDRLNATQRTRQILINLGMVILSLVAFAVGNPTLDLGPTFLKWAAALTFLGNALAGIVAIPNRLVPVGDDLI